MLSCGRAWILRSQCAQADTCDLNASRSIAAFLNAGSDETRKLQSKVSVAPMTNFVKTSILVLALALMTSCTSFKTSNDYMSIQPGGLSVPESGRALFIFERDNARVAEWWSLGVWEITDRDPQLIGLLHGTMKAAWSVEPGAHDFMINVGGEAQILRTNVVADKTYFVELNHNQWASEGPSSYRFCPVRSGGKNPMTNEDIGTFNTSAAEEMEGRIESANKHIAAVYQLWDEYSPELKKRFTMLPEDGR